MSDFLDTPLSAYDEYLEHHGIKGQKWGVRNAEWYPIDAYRKAKGLVVDAANSDAGKKAVSITKDVASKTKEKAKEAVEFTKKAAKKASEDHAEKKAKRKEQKAEAARSKEEHRREVEAEEKMRILNNGTPAEVLRIADQLTNDELNYARNRNQLLKDIRELDSKHTSDLKNKQFQKKWGALVNAGDTLRKVSQPIEDTATALERYKKFTKVVKDLNKDDDSEKVAPSVRDVLNNPGKYSDEKVKKSFERNQRLKSMNDWAKNGQIYGMPGLFGGSSSEEKAQNTLHKELVKTVKSVKNSGFNAFDRVMRVNKISEMDSVKNAVDDDLLSLNAKYLKNPSQASYDKYANEVVKRTKSMLGKKYDDNYGGLLAQGIDGAVTKRIGYGDYNVAKNKVDSLRKRLDDGKLDYDIPIKKNGAYPEYVQAKKELSAAKKKYEANVARYSSGRYKNDAATREAMRIAKADGWDALTNHQKELLNEAN